MKLYTGGALPVIGPCVLCLGMFDGFHNGHRRVVEAAKRKAAGMRCPCVIWTYARHPLELIAPERAPRMLQSISQRLRAIESFGVDCVCVRPFTREEADTEPEDFIRRVADRVGMRAIVLGRSNTFGKAARGTPAMLEKEGQARGFGVEIVDTLKLGSERVTSSVIRQMLAGGEMRVASAMLGRCYAIEGDVVAGRRIGRGMGFPTINVSLPERVLLPRRGVYAGWADIGGKARPCVLNLGTKPTVGGENLTLEAYLLDYSANLYGMRASIRFFQFIRPERRFSGVDALREAIRLDERRARYIIGLEESK